MHLLQEVIFPNNKFNAPEEMYIRLAGSPVFQESDGGVLYFMPGGKANFDTFYGSFSIEPWKKNTVIDNLNIGLKGTGQFIVKIWHQTTAISEILIQEEKVSLAEKDYTYIPLNQWENLYEGMVFFQLICTDNNKSILSSAAWFTSTLAERSPKLGIVITHYNRKQYALPAIARIKKELLDDDFYHDKISLIVIDNSQNIASAEADGAIVIPNKIMGVLVDLCEDFSTSRIMNLHIACSWMMMLRVKWNLLCEHTIYSLMPQISKLRYREHC